MDTFKNARGANESNTKLRPSSSSNNTFELHRKKTINPIEDLVTTLQMPQMHGEVPGDALPMYRVDSGANYLFVTPLYML